MIKAPYNFVPLEETAFYPEWANHISQDIPFKDGVSGSIEYTMEAKTPIFVRNGYTDRNNPDVTFSHTTDGRYFIPGTSVKGEIRNVLEILSFGKMTRVQDARFGIRDLSDKLYRNQVKDVRCGWLFRDKDADETEAYKLIDCDIPYRISPEEIDRLLSKNLTEFKSNFMVNSRNANRGREDLIRSSYYKYNEILGLNLRGSENCEQLLKESLHISFNSKTDGCGRKIADPDKKGARSGTIIVTGQPDKRQRKKNQKGGKLKWTGKNFEFVFPDSGKKLDVDAQVVEDFISIHKNNFDFITLWEENLRHDYKIPVFFTFKDDKKNKNKKSDKKEKEKKDIVDAIGLSAMFRIPSANFIRGAIPAELQSKQHMDLAECIFGTADKGLGYLKGRVFFSPAFANDGVTTLDEVRTTLSSPKPSYGPLYVKDGTWNNSNARIKGRKRYPVRDDVRSNETGNENTQTVFIPLAKGTKFSGKIYFHNLRQCELGALISALTFNGHTECFHSIGEAKPLGYGKVKITIREISDVLVTGNEVKSGDGLKKAKYYRNIFENEMRKHYPHRKSSESLAELFAMAKGIPNAKESDFTYMRMSTNPSDNEFAQAKSTQEGHMPENLPHFSKILNGNQARIGNENWERVSEKQLNRKIEQADLAIQADINKRIYNACHDAKKPIDNEEKQTV